MSFHPMSFHRSSAASESREPVKINDSSLAAVSVLVIIMTAVASVPGAFEYVESKIRAKVYTDPSLADDPPRLLTAFEKIIKASPYHSKIARQMTMAALTATGDQLNF